MTIRKKVWKLLAIVLACVLLWGLIYLTNEITGYPFGYFTAKHAASEYLEETYPNKDYKIDHVERLLKLGGFSLDVVSPSDPSVHFSLHFYCDGTNAEPDNPELPAP